MTSKEINAIFKECIKDYHITDNENALMPVKHSDHKLKKILYLKNWIDTVQWHFEDLIRDPKISGNEIISLKRRIDTSNQHRTNVVEEIDEHIFEDYRNVKVSETATLNSETPAWLLDRMSILQLKIYHFEEQIKRQNLEIEFIESIKNKLYILKIQEADLEQCYDELISDLGTGKKYMKLYKQMKMYNDPNLNPVFYNNNG